MKLSDPTLLRSQCLIDGVWVGAGVDAITNPATGIGREGSRHGAEDFVEIEYMLTGGLDR